jgi:hypothetical protein
MMVFMFDRRRMSAIRRSGLDLRISVHPRKSASGATAGGALGIGE